MTTEKVLRVGDDGIRLPDVDVRVLVKPGTSGYLRLFDMETGRDLSTKDSQISARICYEGVDSFIAPNVPTDTIINVGSIDEPIPNRMLRGHRRGDKLVISRVLYKPLINIHFHCTVMEQLPSVLGDRKLSEVKRIRIYDYSDYDPRFCNNGGHYGYWTTYTRESVDKWEVSYGTTSDFDFCPCCGNFGCHPDCEYEIVTENEVNFVIGSIDPNVEDFEISYEGEEEE